MITSVVSIIVFTLLILGLVLIVNYAESKLLPQGKVKILINNNNEKSPTVNPGGTLLNALANVGIFIPSACGGGGTCAQCICQIHSGGGEILPTELNHISRKDAKVDWRLACQVKVRENMDITIPNEIFSIQKWECTVISNNNVATFIKELVLKLPDGEILNFQAGGYIQIDIPKYELKFTEFHVEQEYRDEWDKYKIWELDSKNEENIFRAYSIANHPAEANIIKLNVRISTPPPPLWDSVPPGIASSYIFNLKPEDKVVISGPFGEFFIKDTDREMLYIGGGAGMAPMRSHLFHLFYTLQTGRKVTYWYGARSKREMFYDKDFKNIEEKYPNFNYHVALSDPQDGDDWDGYTGFIHQIVYDHYLKLHDDPEEIEYYMCGPPMMVEAAENMLYNLGVEPEMVAFDKF